MELRLKKENTELVMHILDDDDIVDWKNNIRTILIWVGFHPDNIQELFNEEET